MPGDYIITLPNPDNEAAIDDWRRQVSEALPNDIVGNTTTIDGSGVTLLSIALIIETVVAIEAWVVARQVTVGFAPIGAARFWQLNAGYKTDASNNAQFIGAGEKIRLIMETSVATPDGPPIAVLSTSGNKAILNVQGAAGVTFKWQARLSIFQVSL